MDSISWWLYDKMDGLLDRRIRQMAQWCCFLLHSIVQKYTYIYILFLKCPPPLSNNANALPDDTDAAAPSFPELEISHRGHNADDA